MPVMTAARSVSRSQTAYDLMSVSFEVDKRPPGVPPSKSDARRVEQMRRLAAARLHYCALAELVEPVRLVVSELVTNALEHGEGSVTFSLLWSRGTVEIAVRDGSSEPPKEQNPNSNSENGRGLLLVAWVADEHGGAWGVRRGGRETWCTLQAPSPGGGAA
ncbi:ATP-binding protein [Streptomyces formicae]|uniref:ATP-binding protein n=1 Tax=Streptomyces formicae TaxID=1616117 RepID=UPI000BF530F8